MSTLIWWAIIIAPAISFAYLYWEAKRAPRRDGWESSGDERWRLRQRRAAVSSEPTPDVIDAWALTPLADSPIFLQTVAAMPVAGEMAARFAAAVEDYVSEAAS